MSREAERKGINWVFIPPGAPNFGGLWEAAVKSAKSHLKKIVGKAVLTFEELSTFCCDVEAVLNSRPLLPMSEDPNDLTPLTPFMLMHGKSSGVLPMLPVQSLLAPELKDVDPTKRWAHVMSMTGHFWKRWQQEYVTSLQQRAKHCTETPNLEVGDMVLMTHENTPPMEWPLGRITAVFPGNDGQVRTVNIKTQSGIYQRPAYKARKLPFPGLKPTETEIEKMKTEPTIQEESTKETKRRSTRLARKRAQLGLSQLD
jgi:hypothetical protein